MYLQGAFGKCPDFSCSCLSTWEAQDDMETANRDGLQRVEAQPSDIPGDLV